jgi:hypothetical protein
LKAVQLGGWMRGRWLGILALGIAIGLAGGIAFQRRPLREQPRRLEEAADIDALAREVRELRMEVRATPHPSAAQPIVPSLPAERPPAIQPAAPETEKPSTVAPALPTQAEREALATATEVVDGARQAGVWTAADRVRIHQLAPHVRPEDLTALMQRLSIEVNNQKVRLPVEGGPVF